MNPEKSDCNNLEVVAPQPPAFDHPTFPVTFGMNVPGPQVHGGASAPGALPYPPPTAFAPVGPGAHGVTPMPQGGGGSAGYVNPNYPGYSANPAPPYSPPSSGFVDSYSGKLCVNYIVM